MSPPNLCHFHSLLISASGKQKLGKLQRCFNGWSVKNGHRKGKRCQWVASIASLRFGVDEQEVFVCCRGKCTTFVCRGIDVQRGEVGNFLLQSLYYCVLFVINITFWEKKIAGHYLQSKFIFYVLNARSTKRRRNTLSTDKQTPKSSRVTLVLFSAPTIHPNLDHGRLFCGFSFFVSSDNSLLFFFIGSAIVNI